jgi:hypothetical protein
VTQKTQARKKRDDTKTTTQSISTGVGLRRAKNTWKTTETGFQGFFLNAKFLRVTLSENPTQHKTLKGKTLKRASPQERERKQRLE